MTRVSPLITRYITYLTIERGLSSNTLSSYRGDLLRLQRWATENRTILRGLSGRDLDRYIGQLCRDTKTPATINRSLTAIRTFYDFLVFENEVSANPTFDIPSFKQSRSLPHVLSPPEIQRLLVSPDTKTLDGLRDRALLELLLAAGLRLSEAINLRHPNITIARRILKCLGKGHKERQVPFTETAAAWLSEYKTKSAANRTTGDLFFTNQARPLTRQFAWSVIKGHALAAGVPSMTPHSLRHTFATSLLEEGVPTSIVQQLLGHSSISTTEVYLHVTTAQLRRVYDLHHPRSSKLKP